MKFTKIMLGAIAALLIPAALIAASVTASEYIKEHSLYGRSDGLFQRTDSKGFDLHINGYRLQSVGKAVYEDFTEYGDGDLIQIGVNGGCISLGTAAAATVYATTTAGAANIDLCSLPSGNRLVAYQTTAQTVGIDMDAGSLDLAGDLVDDEALEIAWGYPGASGGVFVVGEDPAFYQCARLTVSDVSSHDDLWLTFRSYEALNGTWNNYNTYAAIGPISGNVTLETEDDGAGATTTDTTEDLADGGTDTYCVYVSAAGVVTYTIDGHAPATTAAFTFDDGQALVAAIHNVNATTIAGDELDLLEWEVGYQ